MENNLRNRPSLFFPIVLITVGIVWLLVNNGMIAVENVYRLIPYWPVLLILLGIGIIIERVWWPLSSLMWLAAAAAVIWVLLAAPGLLPDAPVLEMKREVFREPLGQATSADVTLDLSTNQTRIYALQDSEDLIVADLSYTGNIIFQVSGTETKTVRVDETLTGFPGFFRLDWSTAQVTPWEIGLTSEIPLRLLIDTSTGRSEIDLTAIQLESLTVDGSTGRINLILPEGHPRFPFNLDASTGGVDIIVPQGTSVDMNIDGSTGRIVIDVPDDAGVQVDVRDGGTGRLSLPDDYRQVREGRRRDEGIWENDAYATAANPIRIILDISTGGIEIR
jgi:hypothetical protein